MPQKLTREIFIKRSNIIHKNKYDYSKVEYKNSQTKVTIICPIENHGDFLVTPSHHMNSQTGCSKCSGNHKYTTLEYIAEVTKIHGDKYDYSKTIYVNAHSKIKVICPIHGEFELKACSHLTLKTGCSKCVGCYNYTPQEYIEKCKVIHGNKFNYSKTEYTIGRNKVIIICPIHGEFEQLPRTHLESLTGCPDCSNEIYKNKSGTYEEFIKLVNEKHGDTYDYSLVKKDFINFKSIIEIICKTHGIFKQVAGNHFRGNGCSECSIYNRTVDTDIIISEFTEIHGDRYDYSKVDYITCKHKVIIGCKIHGDFEQNPQCHRSGQGCPECSVFNRKVDTDIFIEDSRKIHGNKYDYSKVEYTKNKNKVTIICPKHGDFEQQALSHKRGFGCPRCAITQTSKPAILWLSYCGLTNEIQYKVEKDDGEYLIPDTRYKADGYCKDTNTIYEFHGDFWHGNPKIYDQNKINPRTQTTFGTLYEKKEKKKTILISKGYKYVELWENEWNKAIKLVKYIQRKWRNTN